ncbi:MAG: glycosyltransferase family 39 protein [Deltaproteobacteria bacterium]|nr:glycosyltransferase family 39 protein [Deltaproteobacteria bacterium]
MMRLRSRLISDPDKSVHFLFLGVIAIALFMRVVCLGHIAGVNGDEAWAGVQLQAVATGKAPENAPSGLAIEPFYSGFLSFLQKIFPPSFEVLRIPPLAAGILAVLLAYIWLCRVLPKNTALFCALVMAILPMNIAYSRMAWGPSLIPLFTLFPIYYALKGKPLGAAMGLYVALAIHPTSIFVVPTAVGPLVARGIARIAAVGPRKALAQWPSVEWTLTALVLLACAFIMPSEGTMRTAAGPNRGLELSQWSVVPGVLTDFFSGLTAYRYFASDPSPLMSQIHSIGFATLMVFLACTALPHLVRARKPEEIGLVVGAFATFGGFLLLGGNSFMGAGYSRYGMVLITPFVVSVGVLLGQFVQVRRVKLVLAGCGALFLLSFGINYFGAFLKTGGTKGAMFWTGPTEPKARALQVILENSPPEGPIRVVADDWWTHWPIRYLARAQPRVEVTQANAPQQVVMGFQGGSWIVGFTNGLVDHYLRSVGAGGGAEIWHVPAYSGRPAIVVGRRGRK